MDTLHRLARATRAATAYDFMSPSEAARFVTGTPADDTAPMAEISADTAPWSGVLVFEGQMTGDGRLIEDNALRWENLPIPLRDAPVDTGGHDGAQVVGRIDTIERAAGGRISATGVFDLGSQVGRDAHRRAKEGLTNGVSVDLDDVSFEVRIAGDLVDEMNAMMEALDESEPSEAAEDDGAEERDAEGRVTVATIKSDDEVMVTTSARIRAATLVAIPAFAEARVDVGEQTAAEDSPAPADPPAEPAAAAADTAPALVAGAGPVKPPRSWFNDPGLPGPTALTVTEDGRVYGHLAVWGTCHIGYAGQCVSPPSSPSGYAYFRTGAVLTDSGDEVAVGPITASTLHADTSRRLSAAEAAQHYDNTGSAAAYVAAGEDAHGIWVAGYVRPDATADQVRALRASPLSGDWRRVGTELELVAALAVNLPGFPVPRTQALVASGAMQSLVAAGMLPPRQVLAPGQPGALSADDLRYLKALAAREREQQRRETPAAESDDLTIRARAAALRVRAARYRSGTTSSV